MCASRISRAKNIVEKLNRISQGMDGRAALIPGKRTVVNLPQSLKYTLDCYIQFCKEVGNDFSTIDYKNWLCGRFLKSVCDAGCSNIENLSSNIVQEAFLSIGGYMRYWQKLNPFFHFLYEQNLTKQDFSKLIQKCTIPQPHPTTYSIEEIRRLESSFDLSAKNDIRNYAITLLMSRYGIRACDVAALTFDNVDFLITAYISYNKKQVNRGKQYYYLLLKQLLKTILNMYDHQYQIAITFSFQPTIPIQQLKVAR